MVAGREVVLGDGTDLSWFLPSTLFFTPPLSNMLASINLPVWSLILVGHDQSVCLNYFHSCLTSGFSVAAVVAGPLSVA